MLMLGVNVSVRSFISSFVLYLVRLTKILWDWWKTYKQVILECVIRQSYFSNPLIYPVCRIEYKIISKILRNNAPQGGKIDPPRL